MQTHQIPAVIVHDGQCVALPIRQRVLGLAVHLPQLVRFAALKSSWRCSWFGAGDQVVARENPVDGAHGQLHRRLLAQQNPQLLGSPAGLSAQRHHLLLGVDGRAPRTAVRPPTLFSNRAQRPCFFVPPQPKIPRRPRNPELPAQLRQSFPLALRANHKLDALVPQTRRPPWHRRPSRPATLTPSVKDLLATGVKDVMAPHTKARPYNASVGLTPLGLLGGLAGAWRFACLCSALGLLGYVLLLRTNRIFLRRWIARRLLGLRHGSRPVIRCHCR